MDLLPLALLIVAFLLFLIEFARTKALVPAGLACLALAFILTERGF